MAPASFELRESELIGSRFGDADTSYSALLFSVILVYFYTYHAFDFIGKLFDQLTLSYTHCNRFTRSSRSSRSSTSLNPLERAFWVLSFGLTYRYSIILAGYDQYRHQTRWNSLTTN